MTANQLIALLKKKMKEKHPQATYLNTSLKMEVDDGKTSYHVHVFAAWDTGGRNRDSVFIKEATVHEIIAALDRHLEGIEKVKHLELE